MPIYYKPGNRKGNRSWVVRGYIDGRQYEIATGAAHKKGEGGAERAWAEFERAIRCQDRGVPTRQTATFSDAVALYRDKRRDLSRNEDLFVARLEAQLGPMLLADIDLETLYRTAHALYPRALPQTKNRQALRPAGAVLHNAARRGLCDWLTIERLVETDPERPIIYPEDLAPLIVRARDAGDLELAALLTTFQMHGWRVTETIMIERKNVDWRRRRLYRWVSKSRKWKLTEVDDAILAAWRTLPRHDDCRLFSYRDRNDVYRAIDRLGAPFRFRPHMARRGLVTALRDEGIDLADIAEIGQWDDPRSPEVYAAPNAERVRRALGKIRGRLRGKPISRGKSTA